MTSQGTPIQFIPGPDWLPTNSLRWFTSNDNRFSILQQLWQSTRDGHGEWRPIEIVFEATFEIQGESR